MPFVLPPITRRSFLAGAIAGAAGFMCRNLLAADATDPDCIALLSDSHISADRAAVNRNVNMADHLAAVVKEVAARERRPAIGVVVGDLALKNGQPSDYGTFGELLKPLRTTGMPLHLMLGNHDDRKNFIGAFANDEPRNRPAGGRIAEIVSLPQANLFILDTLDVTNQVPGVVGEQQLSWLAKELDARATKPALILGHHDPMFQPPAPPKKPGGLMDTTALFKLLEPRRHVKAYIYGHTHFWDVKEHSSGIHLINLPPTAYVFVPAQPSGWVDATLKSDGAKLQLRCIDKTHAKNGQIVDLKWRK